MILCEHTSECLFVRSVSLSLTPAPHISLHWNLISSCFPILLPRPCSWTSLSSWPSLGLVNMSSPQTIYLKPCVTVRLSAGLGHCWWFKAELQGVLAWLGSDPIHCLAWLAPGRGSGRRDAALWEMSLYIYRSSIRPMSSGGIKSCTKQIIPPPQPLPGFHTWSSFRLSKRFLKSSFLLSVIVFYCHLCYKVHVYVCVRLLFHCGFLFSLRPFYWLISSILLSLSSLSLFRCTSVIVIIACSLKDWPSRYISYEFLFCSNLCLYC